MTALLQIRDLTVTFATRHGAVHSVDGVSFAVGRSEVLGLVCESGSGKSVSLRAITRLLPDFARVSGQVAWQGEDVLAMSPERLRRLRGGQIGMVFQEPMSALNPVLPIGLQITESLIAHTDLDARARRARALELLDLVGIAAGPSRLSQFPHEFSGGMRQRAMIAIALAANPAVLLADEPTTALDVTIQDQILRLLRGLVDELGMALVLVTHDLGVIAETCDRVAVMYAGRLCETGDVAAVFARPRHAYTAALLQAMPGEGTRDRKLLTIPGQAPRLDAPAIGCAFAPRCALVRPICTTDRPVLQPVAPRQSSACHAAADLAA